MLQESQGELPDQIAGHALAYSSDWGGYFLAQLLLASDGPPEIQLPDLMQILSTLRQRGVLLLLIGKMKLAFSDGVPGLLVHVHGIPTMLKDLPPDGKGVLSIQPGVIIIRDKNGDTRTAFP